MNLLISLTFFLAVLIVSASARASEKCGAKHAIQWLACCPIPLKNGLLIDTTCPKDFEDSDPVSAKACYYDCAYKDIGVMTKDGLIVPDKIDDFVQDYFKDHPDFQVAAKKAIAVTLDKMKGSMGKVKDGDKQCDQTALQFTLMSYNHVLRNCPRFVDSKECNDLKASGC